jgi:chromosome segregation ATPase
MSRIYKLLKKQDEERAKLDAAENMDVNEIKKKILEKIGQGKSESFGKEKLALSILSGKLGVSSDKPDDDAAKAGGELVDQLKERSRVVSDLESKLVEELKEIAKEDARAVSSVDLLMTKVLTQGEELKSRAAAADHAAEESKTSEHIAEIEKLKADISRLKNELSANTDRIEALKESEHIAEIEKLKGEVSRLNDELSAGTMRVKKLEDICRETIKEKDEALLRVRSVSASNELLEKRASQLIAEARVREKRLEESDALSKEMHVALKDLTAKTEVFEDDKKDLEERLSQVISELAEANRQLAEAKRFNEAADAARERAEIMCGSLEKERADFEERASQLLGELSSRSSKLDEMEKLNREIDRLARESSFKLHATEREKKELETKTAALNAKLEEAVTRYNTEKSASQEKISKLKLELDMAKHLIKEKEKDDIDLREALSQAVSGLESRDRKIGADLSYYENILKEMDSLKQQVRAFRSKKNNPTV